MFNGIPRFRAMARMLSPVLLAVPLALTGVDPASAEYPERTVRIIVPYASGGPTDLAARLVAQELQKQLKQPFIVENRGGAGGNLGAEVAMRSEPDGYTLLVIGAAHVINQSAYRRLPYSLTKDFVPVAAITTTQSVLLANPKFPAGTVAELLALARAKPGTLNYASSGNGTAPHLTMELLKVRTGIDIAHVPYKGSAPALADMVAGHVPIAFDSVVVGQKYAEAGQLKALAVAGSKRSPILPNTPTMAEAGLPEVDSQLWYGLVAPAGTPAAVVERLNAAVSKLLADPAVRERLAGLGAEPMDMKAEAFGRFIGDEITKWAAVVKAANVRLD